MSRKPRERWPLLGATIIHRYGRICRAKTSCWSVTASSHREAAFAAAEFLMDYLKTRAPFWKQVEKADGTTLGRCQSERRCRRRTLGDASAAANVKRRNECTWRRLESDNDSDRGRDGCCPRALDRASPRRRCRPILKCRAVRIRMMLRPRRMAASGTRRNRRARSGILDPKTGQAIQISLGKGSAPHGVIVGPDRAAWITDGGQNAIARFDPATKAVKLFRCRRNFPTPTSTRRPSTARACSGSPDRTASMAGSIRRAARLRPGRRRRDLGPTASRRRQMARSGTPRWPATTLRRSIP